MRRAFAALAGLVLLGSGFAEPAAWPLSLGTPVPVGTEKSQYGIAAADVTGDGQADIVLTNYSEARVTVLPGAGDGSFGTAQQIPIAAEKYSTHVRAARLNGDAAADIVVDHWTTSAIDVLLSDGQGGFSLATYAATPPNDLYSYFDLGDWNRDGSQDIVTVTRSGKVRVMLNQGDGTFGASQQITISGTAPTALAGCAVADFDGDGDLDVVAEHGYELLVLRHDEDGTLTPGPDLDAPAATPVDFDPRQIVAADFDGDGAIDVAAAGPVPYTAGGKPGEGYVLVFRHTAAAAFDAGTAFAATGTANFWDLAAADLNGDGRPEIVTANELFMNLGDGTFAPAQAYGTVPGTSPAVANFDADPTPDIAVTNSYYGTTLIPVTQAVAPTIATVTPSTLYLGARYDVVVTGTGFEEGTSLLFGPGITLESLVVASETSLTATVSVDLGALPGARMLALVNPNGTAASAPITVSDGGYADITELRPAEAHAGDRLEVTLSGSRFAAGLAASLGDGVSVEAFSQVEPTAAKVTVSIPIDAAPGPRDLTVANGTGLTTVVPAAFTVLPPRSIDLTAETGRLRAAARARPGLFSARGSLRFNQFSPDRTFVPTGETAEVRFGSASDPVVVEIGADVGWRIRGDRVTWRSERGAASNVRLQIDFARQTFRLDARSADLRLPSRREVLVEVKLGDETGTSLRTWRQKRHMLLLR
jgi:hypothetical protein